MFYLPIVVALAVKCSGDLVEHSCYHYVIYVVVALACDAGEVAGWAAVERVGRFEGEAEVVCYAELGVCSILGLSSAGGSRCG